MKQIEVYNKQWCRIQVDLSRKRVIQRWQGFLLFEQFKEAIDVTREAIQKYELVSVLSDTKNQQIVGEDSKDYAAKHTEEALNNGIRWIAFVMPDSEAARIVVNEYKAICPKDLIRHFETFEEAERWLDLKSKEIS